MYDDSDYMAIPLGTTQDAKGKDAYAVLAMPENNVHIVPHGNFRFVAPTLFRLAPKCFWVRMFKSERKCGYDQNEAINWIIHECRKKGEWKPPRAQMQIHESNWHKIKIGQWFKVSGKKDFEDYRFYLDEGSRMRPDGEDGYNAKSSRHIKGLEYAEFDFKWCDTHGEIERVS